MRNSLTPVRVGRAHVTSTCEALLYPGKCVKTHHEVSKDKLLGVIWLVLVDQVTRWACANVLCLGRSDLQY